MLWGVGRRDPPTPAPGPGPEQRRGVRSDTPAQGLSPRPPVLPPSPACPQPHHAQHTVGLALQRLRQRWNVYTLGDSHCPSIQVSHNHIQLWTEGGGWSGTRRPASRAWSMGRTQGGPHQLLGLCLEGCVDANDEGRGRAENLQELRRQDGHVGEAAKAGAQ